MKKDEEKLKMIGASLKRKREETGYTQEMVAEHLNITSTAYARYEAGKAKPDILRLIHIAEFFECGLDELLVGISPKPDDQAKHMASLLHGLKRSERMQIVKIFENIVLLAKGKSKVKSIYGGSI